MFRLPRSLLLTVSVATVAFVLTAPMQSFAADAALAKTGVAHEQAIQQPTGKFIQDLGDQAIKIIANKQQASDQRNSKFTELLSTYFDLKTIGRFVIGRSWNAATPEQQTEYMDLFKALVIKNYGSRMTLYTGEGFEVTGVRDEGNDMDTTVTSHITHPDGSQPTVIDWRVRKKDGKMGVIDVIVEGVSLSVTQRQEYAAVIQSNGGQIDGLLKAMRDELKSASIADKTAK